MNKATRGVSVKLPDVMVPVAYRMVTAMYVSSVDLLSVHYSRT